MVIAVLKGSPVNLAIVYVRYPGTRRVKGVKAADPFGFGLLGNHLLDLPAGELIPNSEGLRLVGVDV